MAQYYEHAVALLQSLYGFTVHRDINADALLSSVTHMRVYFVSLLHFISAELEITVNLLIQVDKLVQLIESPVFTCTIRLNEV